MLTNYFHQRRIPLLSAVLLVIFLLSACQPVNKTPPVETPAAPTLEPGLTPAVASAVPTVPSTPTATPVYRVPLDQLQGLQIVFDHPWTGATADVVDKLVDTFNQTNEWGIHIKVRRAGSSMALANRVERGPFDAEYPQVVVAPSEHLLSWLENGDHIRPLNDLIGDPYFGLTEQQRTEYPLVFWQQDQSNGNQAGIPVTRDAPVLYYNQTWATELGFAQPPVTWQEFFDQVCAAAFANAHDRTSTNDGTGGWLINTEGLVVYSWLKSFGLQNELGGNPLQFHFNQPATLDAFTALRGMMDQGCAWVSRTSASNEYFATRQALIYAGPLSDLMLQAKTNARLKNQDRWMILPFPETSQPVVVASGLSMGVLRSTEPAEVAGWLFVRWMSQPENAVQIFSNAGGFPVSQGAAELAQPQIQADPQWAIAESWLPFVQSAPPVSGWRIARFVLQDAFWQTLQANTRLEDLPTLIEQIDSTILEIQSQPGR